MEVKRGYKQTEVGVIPEDWEVRKLGSFADITKLAGFEYSKYFNSYKDAGEIIVIRGTNITHNKLDLSDIRTIPRKTSNFLQRSKLNKGDLVFAYVGTIGPVYLMIQSTILCEFRRKVNWDAPFRPSLFSSSFPSLMK